MSTVIIERSHTGFSIPLLPVSGPLTLRFAVESFGHLIERNESVSAAVLADRIDKTHSNENAAAVAAFLRTL